MRSVEDNNSTQNENSIREVIPLGDIVSIQLAVSLPTNTKNKFFFLPLPDKDVIPNAIQIFVKSSSKKTENNENQKIKVYQFTKFDSVTSKAGNALSEVLRQSTPLDRFYCYLDHAWREKVTVPVEGVPYAN
ncbi:hypothetical protein AGDE_08208 [Angomonas deanei]|uniref:Uncharacterized protein n=1 Tax=Angomonas deanei TaxID=59799 RepID=A0A7G2CM82_9TRYP|nr:hypothetical protein AGDE_08208 [Angomonas deanei]CAD2220167.1 hypothetical protein, conserved [Angomonas deanei]|eukprot:EPY33589.1 hypothetical protein AGDE_08208 [Angomonas deanei]